MRWLDSRSANATAAPVRQFQIIESKLKKRKMYLPCLRKEFVKRCVDPNGSFSTVWISRVPSDCAKRLCRSPWRFWTIPLHFSNTNEKRLNENDSQCNFWIIFILWSWDRRACVHHFLHRRRLYVRIFDRHSRWHRKPKSFSRTRTSDDDAPDPCMDKAEPENRHAQYAVGHPVLACGHAQMRWKLSKFWG